METNFLGYDPNFLGEDLSVPIPKLPETTLQSVARQIENKDHIIPYGNFSLVQHATRKFPLLTASNIHASQFQKITRDEVGDGWKKDPRIPENMQLGLELYRAEKSDFDRGHMVKREDVQWGEAQSFALNAAQSTFYYTNAVPQHSRMNQRLWRKLEDYILHDEAIAQKLRINVFTGPVLRSSDPNFVTKVDEEFVKLPTLFWKIIYFTKSDGKLYRVGFLMGQKELLVKDKIIEIVSKSIDPFGEFEHGDTFQVNLSLIESLTQIDFPPAIEPKQDDRSVKLVLEQIEIPGSKMMGGKERIQGLTL